MNPKITFSYTGKPICDVAFGDHYQTHKQGLTEYRINGVSVPKRIWHIERALGLITSRPLSILSRTDVSVFASDFRLDWDAKPFKRYVENVEVSRRVFHIERALALIFTHYDGYVDCGFTGE